MASDGLMAKALSASPTSISATFENVPPLVLPAAAHKKRSKSHIFMASAMIVAAILTAEVTMSLALLVAEAASTALEPLGTIPWGVVIAGFFAQLVDGSLGMGYGITSATVLTSCAGLSPTMASGAVHFAQLGTTAVSGFSHARCGNIDRTTLRRLTPAGVVGALLGSRREGVLQFARPPLLAHAAR